LLSEYYGQELSWGTNTLLVPNLKVGDQSPPIPTVVAPMAKGKNSNKHLEALGLAQTSGINADMIRIARHQ